MKISFLSLFGLLFFSCNQQGKSPVSFNNIWSSPYLVSDNYPNHLVNNEGKYLFVLNKTEWAYFACDNPEGVIDKVKKHGANVIRVHLEGTPYFESLGYDLWPWGGTRKEPDFKSFNEKYWDEVEKRIKLAGDNGIGIDLVLYFTMHPSGNKYSDQKLYWDYTINRLSKYSNILTWEIMNEYIANEAFQDSVGSYFKANDPFRHPVCSSDGTTENALWPQKAWMDLAIVHTCTGQNGYDLADWYLNVARNTRQHGKPAINNETGREKRHRNDDPVSRRKQSWLFNTAGCFWTWHSWDGCEGINDTAYVFDGWQYLKPLRKYFESLPFWKIVPDFTVCNTRNINLVSATLSDPDRSKSIMYCCSKETGAEIKDAKAIVRIKNGIYMIRFIDPSCLEILGETKLESKGLRNENEVELPAFRDDIIVEITEEAEKEKTLIEGTL
jgi:hypothetical protein